MAFIAPAIPAITAIGAVVSAGSAIAGGYAAANAANYQGQVASNNAIIAQQNATRAEQAASADAQNQSQKAAAQGARIRASIAANNVGVNTGSAEDVQAGQRQTGQLETETVFQNDILKAYGYRSQAMNFEAESELDKSKASADITGGWLKGAGSLLSNASAIGGPFAPGSGSASQAAEDAYQDAQQDQEENA